LRHIANFLFISLIIGVNYIVFFHEDTPAPPPVTDAPDPTLQDVEPDTAPTVPEDATDTPAPAEQAAPVPTTVVKNFEGKLKRGDTVFSAMLRQGLPQGSVAPVLAAMRDVYDFRKAQVDHKFKGTVDGKGKILTFEFQTGPLDIHQVEFRDNNYIAMKKKIPVDRRTVALGCTVRSSLFASLTRCGEGPELAAKITDLFAFDVDFFQEIRRGDIVRLLVDKVYVNGRFLKYDTVHAASYEGKFGTYTAYRYRNRDGHTAYYTEAGRALRKEFLKTPLKYTRISSGYTNRRFHPTLHKWRKHLAVDFAAPTNTPVQAVATGTVTYVGKKGASGNLVVIEHAGGYLSYYAHLNRFGRVEVGDRVGQKTVIGYVGQTGRATGPHLHYALKHGRKWVNPLKVKYTTADPIQNSERSHFEANIRPLRDQLKSVLVKGLSERQG